MLMVKFAVGATTRNIAGAHELMTRSERRIAKLPMENRQDHWQEFLYMFFDFQL